MKQQDVFDAQQRMIDRLCEKQLSTEEATALLEALDPIEDELDEIEEHNPELAGAVRKLIAIRDEE